MQERTTIVEPSTIGWREVYNRHALAMVRLAAVLVGRDDAQDLVVETVGRVAGAREWQHVDDVALTPARSGAGRGTATGSEGTDRRRRSLRQLRVGDGARPSPT